jgi:cell division protease FtsH
MAYSMVSVYGLDEKVGNVSFYGLSQDQFQKPYSEDTATLIDDRVREIIEGQYMRAQKLLKDHRGDLDLLAKTLLEKEVIHKSDIERMIGPRPYQPKGTIARDEETATNPVESEINGIPPIPSFEKSPEEEV